MFRPAAEPSSTLGMAAAKITVSKPYVILFNRLFPNLCSSNFMGICQGPWLCFDQVSHSLSPQCLLLEFTA